MRPATVLDVRLVPVEQFDRAILPVHLVWQSAG